MDEQALRGLIARRQGRQAVAPRFRAADGRARADGADGGPDADLFGRRRRRSESSTTSRPSAAAAAPLKVLWWQGPTLLNPHFAVGTKDQDGSRIFYEPLAGWDPDGDLVPVLAAEIPEPRERRRSRADGKSVTWKLKRDVTVARRQAVHRRRRRVQLGIRHRPGDRRGHHRQLQGRQGREGRRPSRCA